MPSSKVSDAYTQGVGAQSSSGRDGTKKIFPFQRINPWPSHQLRHFKWASRLSTVRLSSHDLWFRDYWGMPKERADMKSSFLSPLLSVGWRSQLQITWHKISQRNMDRIHRYSRCNLHFHTTHEAGLYRSEDSSYSTVYFAWGYHQYKETGPAISWHCKPTI